MKIFKLSISSLELGKAPGSNRSPQPTARLQVQLVGAGHLGLKGHAVIDADDLPGTCHICLGLQGMCPVPSCAVSTTFTPRRENMKKCCARFLLNKARATEADWTPPPGRPRQPIERPWKPELWYTQCHHRGDGQQDFIRSNGGATVASVSSKIVMWIYVDVNFVSEGFAA